MLNFVQGDLFDIQSDIRVNTVNCVGVMGAGVALAFKQRYPEMFKEYRDDCKIGLVKPGKMHVWKSLAGDWVINFPTKRDWRDPSRYEDIDAGLDDLRVYLDSVGPVSVALPALGCGHGGLDWSRVSEMIREKLDGVNAQVYVFGPAASHRAGKGTMQATQDERRSVEQLGYEVVEEDVSIPKSTGPAFVMGRRNALQRRWIALLPSREPGERELKALQAIAAELALSDANVTIALTYGTKISEEVADLFAQKGIATVLLLPFGVLTRKALAKKHASDQSRSVTVASVAPPNSKWSRQLFAQTMDFLRNQADSVLLSDPEPDWLANRGLEKWGQLPISYVRYEHTPSLMREALSKVDAKPIGRRGDSGVPNIEHLVTARSDRAISREPALNDQHNHGRKADWQGQSEGGFGQIERTLTVSLRELSDQSRRLLVEEMLHMDLREFAITLRLPADISDRDRNQLLSLGFREDPIGNK